MRRALPPQAPPLLCCLALKIIFESPEFFRFPQKRPAEFVQSFKILYFLRLALCKPAFLIYNGTNTAGRLEHSTVRYTIGRLSGRECTSSRRAQEGLSCLDGDTASPRPFLCLLPRGEAPILLPLITQIEAQRSGFDLKRKKEIA